MSNMSYCRFHNTRIDLKDCLEALRHGSIESKEELRNAISMFEMFLEFCKYEGIIEEFDEEAIQEILERALEEEEDGE